MQKVHLYQNCHWARQTNEIEISETDDLFLPFTEELTVLVDWTLDICLLIFNV